MNLTSSHSSARSSKIKWVFKLSIFILISVILFVTVVSAAEYQVISYYDSTYSTSQINSIKMLSYESTFQQLELNIANFDPAIFTQGRHYTFDSVLAIEFSSTHLYTETYSDAINDLILNGYTSEWYTHYIYGYYAYFEDSTGNRYDLPPEAFYVNPDECVVYANGECYTELSDQLINTSTANKLYLQIKVHFDFTVNYDVQVFSFSWYPYPFRSIDNSNANVRTSTNIDLSNIISYDASTVGAMNLIAVDIKDQVAGMESALVSSVSDLMAQQDRYWELLLGGYEYSDLDFGMGILYEILYYQDNIYGEVVKIYKKVNNIDLNVSTISGKVTNMDLSVTNIKATSQAMLKLLNGTNTTFYDFLNNKVEFLHNDLVDIKNYLDQSDKASSVGSDLSSAAGEFSQSVGNVSLSDDYIPNITAGTSGNWFSQVVTLFEFLIPFVIISTFGILMSKVVGR